MSTAIAPNTVAIRNGPGPSLAFKYKKKKHPMKTNTARMTVGPASRKWPVMISGWGALRSILLRALLARKIPSAFHLLEYQQAPEGKVMTEKTYAHARQTAIMRMISRSATSMNEPMGGSRTAAATRYQI